MRVLITGGAGFIGSHVADAFLARGDQVIVVDDLSRGQQGRLAAEATLLTMSVLDARALCALTESARPHLICHLAAQIDVRASVLDPAEDARANVVGTVNVIEAARLAGARVIFASSGGALYGRDTAVPSAEDAATLPESPYGVAKLCAEHYISLSNRMRGSCHSVLRLANVYGPRQDPAGEAGVAAVFCSRVLAGRAPLIYGDGTQTRDYVYVGDVARAFTAAADNARPGTWNIGTGTETSVLELAAAIGAAADRPVAPQFAPARPGELQRSAVAPGLAAAELGWRSQIALPDGVRRVLRWVRDGTALRAGC
ncbi:MAG TPA: NAD-dependent epimerase/dehydratase family protein [Trebonia sp.]|jgi:UDP-glucose 4-epimerase|nr:NAD-dependent epimerase/dehydratase family protein [Trebonia sp.]